MCKACVEEHILIVPFIVLAIAWENVEASFIAYIKTVDTAITAFATALEDY